MIRSKLLLLLVISSVFLSCKETSTKEYQQLKGTVFGTTYNINYNSDKNYQREFDNLFKEFNNSLSTYIPNSLISKINKGDTTQILDKYFIEVIQKSKVIHQKTDGYFDPTVGNLVNAWGFGPEKQMQDLDTAEVKSLMRYVGLEKVILKGNRIIKSDPNIYLDFNSIAKGFGIDVIARFLEGKQVKNYLVEIGGEIRCRGKSSKGKAWKVAIEQPNTDGSQSFQKIISLENKSMATSGNYRKFRIGEHGKKYVHTVNPKTGFATESNLLSASVIANLDCADVDAYATAFMAMGFERTKKFLEKNPKINVFLIYFDEKGEIKEYAKDTYN